MNWIEFLDDNHISYVTRGPNTRKGEVSVRCPFCGEEDPSEHMGIVLEREAWGCHRNQAHRGKAPAKLIQALLGCSWAQAGLVVAQYGAADPETLDQALASLGTLLAPKTPTAPPEQLRLAPEFRLIQPTGSTSRFWHYLGRRGFHNPTGVAETYGLSCCLTGRWKDRIIIPVYQNKVLIAWTGRALQTPVSAPRYLSTSEAIKTTIFNLDDLYYGGNVLFITEGPFDAIKVDYYGYPHGAYATALFGTSVTTDQIALLREVSKNFKKVVVLMDPEAIETSFSIAEWLPDSIIGNLPAGVEDPGALTKEQVKVLVKQY